MQGHIQFLESIEKIWIVILLNAEKFLRIVTQLDTNIFDFETYTRDLNLTSRYIFLTNKFPSYYVFSIYAPSI